MPGREEGRRAALIITQRSDVGEELAEAIAGLGWPVRLQSDLRHLEKHADSRPMVVMVDLALRPRDDQWTSLAQLFPRSALWAITDAAEESISEVIAAFKHGCHDCLSRPISVEQLRGKLAAIQRPPGARPGELDRFMTNELNLELPSDLSVIEHVVNLLAGCCRDYRSYGPRTLVNLRIVVSEALSNAIIYGNQGDRTKKVWVRARVDAWSVKLQITDEGTGFDHRSLPDPRDREVIEESGGRGLFLVRRLADEVSFNERGNAITVTLRSEWQRRHAARPITVKGPDADVLSGLVQRIRQSSGADVHLWAENVDGTLDHVAPADAGAQRPDGTLHWLNTPGTRYALQVRPEEDESSDRWAEFTRDILDAALEYEARVAEVRRDLAERQEEIELLHGMTETLAAVTSVEDAAGQILKGVIRLTGAERASLWIYDQETEDLMLAASEGGPSRMAVDRVPVTSAASVSALAFRENRTIRLDEVRDLPQRLAERLGPKPDPWVAVPVSYTSPTGGRRTVGVLNLIGRRTGAVLSDHGETRLLMTLARQIGSAIENLRLFEEILSRERVIGELELAHDLQMKLLPDLRQFDDICESAARSVPARPVGGDFYQLFRLADGRIGAMLGDVTSHGFSAALIMALSMSVMAIYARESASPGDLLRAIHRVLIQRLESTEMFMTVFYGVIDPRRRTLCYANAGHAHAFRLTAGEPSQRLHATSPPLGIAEYESYDEAEVPWMPGDLLCLFTDGLTNPSLRTTEGAILEAVEGSRQLPANEIVEAMFAARELRGDSAPDDQTAFVLRV